MSWEDKIEVQKGNLGEKIIDQYLKYNGVIPYIAVFDGPHPFDRLIASQDKKTIFIADVKSKARRSYYPDTGINEKNYHQYKYITTKYNIRCYLFFIDEWLEQIYGNFIDVLSQPETILHNGKTINYPFIQNGIIYFPLTKMEFISFLDRDLVENLKNLSTRNYLYKELKRKEA